MTDLQRALYQFAQENRVYPLLHPEQQELRDNQAMFQAARERLCALGAEEADLAERMEDGLLRCSSIEQEAVFLAGLAIGLELGRGQVFGPSAERAAQCAAPTADFGKPAGGAHPRVASLSLRPIHLQPLPYDKYDKTWRFWFCVGEALGPPARIRTRSVGSAKPGADIEPQMF